MADAPTQGPSAVINQLKELWGKQSRGRRMLALLVVVGVLGFVLVTRLVSSDAPYAVVADGASPDDNQEMLAVLEQRGMPVRLANGKVEVKTEKLDQARAIIAAAGLPRIGKGLELFDGSHLGQSSFAEQVNFRRGLQGELARSITALAQVQNARVHLALGKRSVFKDREEGATASVALHLYPGQQLTPDQVRGIRSLVAASVEGMRAESVVIVDNHGNLLDGAEPTAANKSLAIEQSVTSRVRSMLERVVGPGKVWVVTTAVVDDREVSETQELFDNTNPVLRSETRTVEGMDPTVLDGVGGVAGTRGNLPGAQPAGGTGGGSAAPIGNGRLQETKNFEISRTVRQVKKPDAQLAKLFLAVVVDYKAGADGKAAPRSEQELAELTALARQAAGIDDARGDKIDVRSIPFVTDAEATAGDAAAAKPAEQLLPVPLPIAIGAGGGLLVLIAAVILVMRSKKAKKKLLDEKPGSLALPAPVVELERALDARQSHDEDAALPPAFEKPALPPGGSTRDRVLAAVRADVERAAEVLTAWLSEPPPKPTPAAKGAK
ncbi:MAG: flagellar M-ring protein FliF [Kofleriaceae bacterium]|nr:flagellar M-ring protein FliF [Kofleriaceae bacterium]